MAKNNSLSSIGDRFAKVSSSVGTIVGINDAGQALVDFPENTGEPIVARSVLNRSDKRLLKYLPAQVLLTFEQSDLSLPIIVGVVGDCLFESPGDAVETDNEHIVDFSDNQTKPKVVVDGQAVMFDAKDEIVFRCGKSSILLRKDGKVVIKGTNVISRSSCSNKIKGSSVSIN